MLTAYFLGKVEPSFDYSQIRAAGEPIKGFGGLSSGPGPLRECHEELRALLIDATGKSISVRAIVDIQNIIGKMVVSANVRRSAEIAFGPDSDEFLHLKDYKRFPEREAYGWLSNNSVMAELGMDYSKVAARIATNGEPGLFWLTNAQQYGRMGDLPDNKDHRARGANPCMEQTLESYELCCLVETFISRHDTLEDFKRTLKFAYLYAKTVTLGRSHWPETNRVMLRNRRIGCSISGVVQFLETRGIDTLRTWLDAGYKEVQRLDEIYSDWLAIPRSRKTTSVKPSGTVSLLAGATPGMHWPEDRFYIRRMRIAKGSPLVSMLRKSGYTVEPCVGDSSSVVCEVPIDIGPGVRTVREVPMWEQLALAALLQERWSDNQVSATITFDPETENDQISHALDFYQYRLKGISFLPRMAKGAYPQMPYEAITEKVYKKILARLKPLHGKLVGQLAEPEKFCTTDVCEISVPITRG